jgi:hypothetical protein
MKEEVDAENDYFDSPLLCQDDYPCLWHYFMLMEKGFTSVKYQMCATVLL